MSCHKAIVVITGRAHCFHDYIYIYIHVYIYIYIYTFTSKCHSETTPIPNSILLRVRAMIRF